MMLSGAAKFQAEATASLPLHVLQCVFQFVSLAENGIVCAVSKDFREAAEDDSLWEDAYTKRFLTRQGNGSTPDSTGLMSQADRRKYSQRVDGKGSQNGFKRRYLKRIMDPQVGDQVQVSWRSKLRLEYQEVYNATTWWPARVVQKGAEPDAYEVHYPGWEWRWDEWVPRERLRWGNERRHRALKEIIPIKGDKVERWCEGSHVPGACHEAMVHSKA
ncbi:unnamed protein product [Ascophyllum nodosum]